ncbi:MAG: hypothetical protein JW779_05110 [Candidatus Thorarchaeota archaeon]|nr:hypothetical protein [Candidatus Thorarchaeota archaeon]
MGLDDISEYSAETSIGRIRVRLMNLENGLLILLSDKENYRLGLSAVAIPPGHGSSNPTSTGLFTVGLENELVRTMAERVAMWTNQTCLIVVGLHQMNREIMMELLTALKDYLLT